MQCVERFAGRNSSDGKEELRADSRHKDVTRTLQRDPVKFWVEVVSVRFFAASLTRMQPVLK